MKSITNLPKEHREKIFDVSDERNNGDGWWIYLKDAYADFTFDPSNPMRTIHEYKLMDCIKRLKASRLITDQDRVNFPEL